MESAYTTSEEEPTVPPTPAEYDESENPDRTIQREMVSWGFYASAIPGLLENRMAECRDTCSLFFGGGRHDAQPPEPQPEQDHATEAPLSCCTWNRALTRSRARAIPTARTL